MMENKRLYSIRGAVCTENTPDSIIENVGQLCKQLFDINNLAEDFIVNVQFTVTPDLDSLNPATALRRFGDLGFDSSRIPLFCSQEPVIKGMLPKVIRIMITAYMDAGTVPRTLYLNGAEALRPDLAKK